MKEPQPITQPNAMAQTCMGESCRLKLLFSMVSSLRLQIILFTKTCPIITVPNQPVNKRVWNKRAAANKNLPAKDREILIRACSKNK
jgi:hypothetical protein